MRAILYLPWLDTQYFSLPYFNRKSLIAFSLFIPQSISEFVVPLVIPRSKLPIRYLQTCFGDLAACVCSWLPKLYQTEEPT